jgi:hypothetical protein
LLANTIYVGIEVLLEVTGIQPWLRQYSHLKNRACVVVLPTIVSVADAPTNQSLSKP